MTESEREVSRLRSALEDVAIVAFDMPEADAPLMGDDRERLSKGWHKIEAIVRKYLPDWHPECLNEVGDGE